jgi:protein-L-isoaspartate O-methyltransferase
MEMYDNTNTVHKSFDENYLSEELLQAQWAEFIELKKVIAEIYLKKGSPITILDIGIGNARIVKHLSAIPEMWDMIESYDVTDNAEICVNLSRKTVNKLKIENKVTVYFLDAIKLNQLQKQYDLIITTWFTAGNFFPENFPFENYNSLTEKIDLSKNEKFDTIFTFAYEMLNPNGEILIGACYIDNENTKKTRTIL